MDLLELLGDFALEAFLEFARSQRQIRNRMGWSRLQRIRGRALFRIATSISAKGATLYQPGA